MRPFPRPKPHGFTLLELLVTLSIAVTMWLLAAPAFNSLARSQSATTAGYEIAGILQQARAYAMANNTHVFVGLLEENAAQPDSAPPPRNGIGRVIIATFAASDGTKGYDSGQSPQSSWLAQYRQGANLRPLGKLRQFENLHLASSLGPPPGSGAMARPEVTTYYRLGHPSCCSVTPIAWPIGRGLAGGFQYRFEKVIRFDPMGTPRIQYRTNANALAQYMEIGLQQTRGNRWEGFPESPNGGNQTALVIDGITGAIRIYRPM